MYMIFETSSSVTGSWGSGTSDLIELYFSATWSCVVLRRMLHGILWQDLKFFLAALYAALAGCECRRGLPAATHCYMRIYIVY